MRSRIITLLLSGAVVCGTGCGGDTDSTPPPPPATPQVTDLATAVCDLLFRCCVRHELDYLIGPYTTVENCAERLVNFTNLSSGAVLLSNEAAFELRVIVPSLAALERATSEARGSVDDEAMQACLAHLSQLTCNQLEEEEEEEGCTPPEPPEPPSPCDLDLLFIGEVPEGGECSSPPVDQGFGPEEVTLECKPGLVCRNYMRYGVFGECVKPGEVGDPCFQDRECDEELYCSQLYGTCQEYRQEGEPCAYSVRDDPSPSEALVFIRCDPELGLSCDTLTDRCVKACRQGAACAEDAHCDEEQELSCILGRCDLPRAEELPCGTDEDCREGLACNVDPNDPNETERICTTPLPNLEQCTVHNECRSGYCDWELQLCRGLASPGSPCPSQDNAQCNNGRCVQEPELCTEDADCPLSGKCDQIYGICGWYCVGLLPDHSECDTDSECESEACVQGRCRTIPLANGEPCDMEDHCESGFCNTYEDENECVELPLPLGARCGSSDQCESRVCFSASLLTDPTCMNGLDEGEACDPTDPSLPPCNPKKYYCDVWDSDPAVCVPWLETGETCDRAEQCRSMDCTARWGRPICSVAAAEDTVICDGED